MKKKIVIVGGVTLLACLTAGMLFGGSKAEETTYREVAVEYGTLVVGITESGAVDIGTVDQVFELDMSELQRVTTENGSSTGNGMGMAMGGGMPSGSMQGGGGTDMFGQIFNMGGGDSTDTQSSESQLVIGEVCVAVGQQVKEKYQLMEAYNMTMEAAATKLMWVLGQTSDPAEIRRLFYRPVQNDVI